MIHDTEVAVRPHQVKKLSVSLCGKYWAKAKEMKLENLTGNKCYSTLERCYIKKTPKLRLSCSLPLGTAPPRDDQLFMFCYYRDNLQSVILYRLWNPYVMLCHFVNKQRIGIVSFSIFLSLIHCSSECLSRRGYKCKIQLDPSLPTSWLFVLPM